MNGHAIGLDNAMKMSLISLQRRSWNRRTIIFSYFPHTRKYPLCWYILVGQTLHWGGDEASKWVLIYVAWLQLFYYYDLQSSASLSLMDPRDLRVTHDAYFSLLTHTKQLLSVIFCNETLGIGNSKWGRWQTKDSRWTDRREGWYSYLDVFRHWYQLTSAPLSHLLSVYQDYQKKMLVFISWKICITP